ncbi:hypothetical protein [Rhizobium sp. RAF56]|uniref:hypothetical protein n=1 Tax=Rhizobium sp. RAF56 TaxID=3233062 RepID=UPI003F9D43ED
MAKDSSELRADLVQMLMFDRQSALYQNNAGAAVQASSRVVDLLLGRLADEAKDVTPIGVVQTVVVHQHLCIACRQQLGLEAAPVHAALTDAERLRVGGWDEPDFDPDAAAAGQPEPAGPSAIRKPATISVPKLPTPKRTVRRA